MAEAILLKSGGGGLTSDDVTAGKAHVLSGYTTITYESNDEIAIGTMPDNTGWNSKNINAGSSVTIPAGYHDGTQTVTAKALSSQTGVDSGKTAVGAAQMLTGYQGWVNGTKVSGTMANHGAISNSLNAGGTYTIPAGYHNGAGKVTANSLASQTSGTATAARMLSGYTAYVNGSKVTGSITSLAGGTYKASS